VLNLNDLHIRQFLADCLAENPGAFSHTILDLGCGSQPYRQLYGKLFKTLIAGDLRQNKNISVLMEASKLPFVKESIDLVILTEVIEHVNKPQAALKEIARVLRENGLLIITWPLFYPIHDFPEDFYRFTEFGMHTALNDCGLKDIKIKRRGSLLSVLHTIIGQCLLDVSEAIRRIPLLGFVLRPFAWLIDLFVELSYKLNFIFIKNLGLIKSVEIGNDLRGIKGYFARWTLGYCAVAVKTRK
jgi:SAM-dependent methyltransferase